MNKVCQTTFGQRGVFQTPRNDPPLPGAGGSFLPVSNCVPEDIVLKKAVNKMGKSISYNTFGPFNNVILGWGAMRFFKGFIFERKGDYNNFGPS